ncbi:MAG: hypothetical protein E4H14_02385 [Candidatus Thorarchaeota archaeon]|nr:MAG: hypothetical protein E4H14_02385 [Candidatus Thorarchaeota archaeon]
MTKRTLESLKATFGNEANQRESLPNNYYPFWLMKAGQKATIRFAPDKDDNNVRGFLVEKVFHNLTVNGKKTTVPCLTQYGEECPICKVSQDYYKVKDEINGKKYWRKKQYLAQALILEDPIESDADTGENHEGKVRYLALGYQLYNIIKEAFASDELDSVPYDFEDGYDFTIKKTEQGSGEKKFPTYTMSRFKDDPRSLDESELAVLEEGMIELATLLPRNPGFDKVKALLDADLNGEDFSESDSESAPAPAATKVSSKPTKPAKDDAETPAKPKKPAKSEEAEDGEDGGPMTDVDAMLAAIKARRKQS